MPKIVTTRPEAKARMSRARDLARKADLDPLSAALFDRWYAETLMSARGVRAEAACAMLTRMAIALEVMADRKGWPAGRVAGVTG